MKRCGLLLVALVALAGMGGSCETDGFGATRLIVINNSTDTVFVEVDEHADGDIDVRATLGPGSTTDWILDDGPAVVVVDGEGFDIFLDDNFDGIFEITDE